VLVRIYDKAAERGFTDGRRWARVSLQLRDKRAEGVFQYAFRSFLLRSPVLYPPLFYETALARLQLPLAFSEKVSMIKDEII